MRESQELTKTVLGYVNESDYKTIASIFKDISGAANFAKTFRSDGLTNYRGSIAKRAAGLVLTFPVLISTSIKIDVAIMISKAIERKCVSLLQILFSAINLSEHNNTKDLYDYISKFHTNLDPGGIANISLDDFIRIMQDGITKEAFTYNTSKVFVNTIMEQLRSIANHPAQVTLNEFALNDYHIKKRQFGEASVEIDPQVYNEANYDSDWDLGFAAGRKKTKEDTDEERQYRRQVEQEKRAYEATKETERRVYEVQREEERRKYQEKLDAIRRMQQMADEKDRRKYQEEQKELERQYREDEKLRDREYNEKQKELDRQYNERQKQLDREWQIKQKEKEMRDKAAFDYKTSAQDAEFFSRQIVDGDIKKANELQPTNMVVQFQILSDDGKYTTTQSGIVGVKAKMYPIDSVEMLRRISSKYSDSNWFMKLVKASTGEISFWKDLIFSFDKMKREGIKIGKGSVNAKLFNLLERRAARNNSKFFKATDANPITTLVISSDEVEYLKKNNNIDLNKPTAAMTLFSSYNLMGLVIVNDGEDSVSFLFDDGDASFEKLSYKTLERENKDNGELKKMINLLHRGGRI